MKAFNSFVGGMILNTALLIPDPISVLVTDLIIFVTFVY